MYCPTNLGERIANYTVVHAYISLFVLLKKSAEILADNATGKIKRPPSEEYAIPTTISFNLIQNATECGLATSFRT